MEALDVFNSLERDAVGRRKPEAWSPEPEARSLHTCCRASPSETCTSIFFLPR